MLLWRPSCSIAKLSIDDDVGLDGWLDVNRFNTVPFRVPTFVRRRRRGLRSEDILLLPAPASWVALYPAGC